MTIGHHRRAYCGVDVGTQGIRAVLVDDHGRQIGRAAAPLLSSVRSGDRHEQDPVEWRTALFTVLRALTTDAPDVAIEALALDATSGTVVVERADGTPSGPALMYDDRRAAAQLDRVRSVGQALWQELGYDMQASWGLPKVVWLLENGLVGSGDRVVHQADHLVRQLTGTPVATDTSNALKTGADPRTAEWPADLFDELGVRPGALPPLVDPGTVVGTISADVARHTGVVAGTPVRAGMTDGCAAQIASGALEIGSGCSSLGTTLIVKASSDRLVHDPSGAVYSHRNPDGGWLPGGASSVGAGAITGAFGNDPDRLDALTAEAQHLGVILGATYPLVGAGERFPFVAHDARAFLSANAVSPAAQFAALCQGIAYVERLSYAVLADLGVPSDGPVSLTGGTTRNRWWNQLRTDVMNRPTFVVEDPEPAHGMAILAAAQPGRLTATASHMVRVAERFEPDPTRSDELAAGYTDLVGELRHRGWLRAPARLGAAGR